MGENCFQIIEIAGMVELRRGWLFGTSEFWGEISIGIAILVGWYKVKMYWKYAAMTLWWFWWGGWRNATVFSDVEEDLVSAGKSVYPHWFIVEEVRYAQKLLLNWSVDAKLILKSWRSIGSSESRSTALSLVGSRCFCSGSWRPFYNINWVERVGLKD